MLYFLYGEDEQKARKKLHELLDLASKKRPGAEVFRLTTENWSEGKLDELVLSRGLFEAKYTVVLDRLFEKKEIKDYFLEHIQEIASSEQIFLCLEGRVDTASLKKIKTHSKQVQVFEEPKSSEKVFAPSIFSVTDGLVKRDKRGFWISFIEKLDEGFGAEEMHGVIFWQVKNMLLASRTKNIGESGLTPFAYRNASLGAKKYEENELLSMSSELVDMTHRVRLGKGDLEIMLEKWILSI